MPESPDTEAGRPVQIKITSDGVPLDETIQVVSVAITFAINTIPSARIVVLDGDISTLTFPVCDGNLFKPGSPITIEAGYAGQTELIFQGIVVGYSLKIAGDCFPQFVVECRDKAVLMTIDRKNASYVNMKDSDIIRKLVGSYNGLTSDVGVTDVEHEQVLQRDCTDWDFLLSRASANGLLVIADQNKILVQPAPTSGTALLKVTYGSDLMAFDASSTPLMSVNSGKWGLDTKATAGQTAASSARLEQIRGHMRFQGSAGAKIGQLISVDGVGQRFSGEVFVSAVNHEFADGSWTTEVRFGLSRGRTAERPDSILIADQNGNKVQLSSGGILFDSAQDILIAARGKIALSAGAEFSATAKADVKVTGLNITNAAEIAFTAKGSASAELSASGQTTVRGALVMIN